MEENKAKTTAAEEVSSLHVDGTDALAVTSSQEHAEETNGQTDAHGEAALAGEEAPTPKHNETDKSGSDAEPVSAEEVNRENARRRREEARLRELKNAREAAIIEALDGKNPYNGEEMRDAAAVERFLAMKAERAAAPAAGTEEWYRRDREAFVAAHPDVSLETLIRDPRFQTFSDGKVGHLPMEEIWAGYQSFLGQFDEKAKNLAAQTVANRLASPGTLGGSGSVQSDYYSPEDVRRMSPREVRENYEKIRNSMAKW